MVKVNAIFTPEDSEIVGSAKRDAMHLDNIRSYLESSPPDIEDGPGWGENLQSAGLSVISATEKPTAKVIFEYTCHQSHANRLGNLHGGCASTIFDFCTTMALFPVAKPDFWTFAGVSRTLNVTYLRPIPVGETVIIECEVIAIGKRMATITGTMKRKSDGGVMCICEHGKVNVEPRL